jgi:hypothetical protein
MVIVSARGVGGASERKRTWARVSNAADPMVVRSAGSLLIRRVAAAARCREREGGRERRQERINAGRGGQHGDFAGVKWTTRVRGEDQSECMAVSGRAAMRWEGRTCR